MGQTNKHDSCHFQGHRTARPALSTPEHPEATCGGDHITSWENFHAAPVRCRVEQVSADPPWTWQQSWEKPFYARGPGHFRIPHAILIRHVGTCLWKQQLPPTHIWWSRSHEGSHLPLEADAMLARDPYTVPRIPLTTCTLDWRWGRDVYLSPWMTVK